MVVNPEAQRVGNMLWAMKMDMRINPACWARSMFACDISVLGPITMVCRAEYPEFRYQFRDTAGFNTMVGLDRCRYDRIPAFVMTVSAGLCRPLGLTHPVSDYFHRQTLPLAIDGEVFFDLDNQSVFGHGIPVPAVGPKFCISLSGDLHSESS